MKPRTFPVSAAVLTVLLLLPALAPALAESGVPEAQYDETATKLGETSSRVLDEALILRVAGSPCGPSLTDLAVAYSSDPRVRGALSAVLAGLQDPPPAYRMANPWKAASTGAELLRLILETFLDWCVFLPEISGDQDNGLAYIQQFAWFYYRNAAGIDFVQGRNPLVAGEFLDVGLRFTEAFSKQRGYYMSSPASKGKVGDWIADPRIEISDYQKQKASDYDSWNDFFARQITIDKENQTIPSRPATMPLSEYPERDYIVVAPTDCIMNPLVQVLAESSAATRQYVENPLQYDTVLDVKGIPISLSELLDGVPEPYRRRFVGGTGLSCVLMPNTYHHYHAPVNGRIVHAKVLDQYGTYGYEDWPNWVPADGNVGRPGTDFSQFQAFERGVIIIEVEYTNVPGAEKATLTGYVASIPVGLDTIGSVVLADGIEFVQHDGVTYGKTLKRGYTELGHFLYGGSLNILLFSSDLIAPATRTRLATPAIQTRLGNQIALFNIGKTPGVKPETP